MRGKWGIAWLAGLIISVSLTCVPSLGLAADNWSKGGMPSVPAGQTSIEAQMLGEKPFQSRPAPIDSGAGYLSGLLSGMQLDNDGVTVVKLPRNLEMRISFLYNQDKPESPEPTYVGPVRRQNRLLVKYSLDYRLLPNLQVGLNAYLYRPDNRDNLSLSPQFTGQVMGLGPGLKYDLGRWSFLVKSQVETGNREHGTDLQNWFRVWYAF